MNIKVAILRRFSILVVLFSFCVVAMITTYVFQLEETNYYIGMQPWKMNLMSWGILVVGLLLIVVISLHPKGFPSEFFLVFYSSIVILSFLSLNSSSGVIERPQLLFSFLIIIIPVIVVWVTRNMNLLIINKGLLSPKIVEGIVFGVVLLVSAVAVLNPPASAGLDIISSYDRRLEGRDLYRDGSIISYALAMSMNGLNPYLSYKAGILGRKILLIATLIFALIFYWLIGIKSSVLYVFLSYILGILVAKDKHKSIIIYLLLAIILLFSVTLLEWWFYDFSIVSEYIFRRVFAVQAQIQGYCINFIMGSETSPWSLLAGSAGFVFKPSFFIGDYYFGDADINANMNAFFYAFMLYGALGYLFAVLFVSIMMITFDSLYSSSKNPSYLFLGFIFGLLLIEQSFSTAIVSSGVGVLFILTLLEKYQDNSSSSSGIGLRKIIKGVVR